MPLKCGGADAPFNMQWLTVADHAAKTRAEAASCKKRRTTSWRPDGPNQDAFYLRAALDKHPSAHAALDMAEAELERWVAHTLGMPACAQT